VCLRRNNVAVVAISFIVACLSAAAEGQNFTLRSAVDHAMAGQKGTAVVLAVDSGRRLAAYHPEVAAQRLALPGSSIKPFTLMALLNSDKIDAQTTLFCKRPLTIAGHRLDCSHPETAQPFDPATALAYSCNFYFTTMATRLTPARLRETLIKEGFAGTTGLASKEASGTVALAQSRDELQLQAIGEWGVDITPLELLRAYRNLALLASGNSDPALRPIFEGLEGSTSYGMARSAQPENGVRVAGKTGTSKADDGEWTHGWFSGFAPAENPKVVLVIFLERGRGSDAADIARHIFAVLDKRDKASQQVTVGSRP
jgi:penicillin-binding protein 2